MVCLAENYVLRYDLLTLKEHAWSLGLYDLS